MVILVDDEDRENEGDLAMAAEAVTPEAINFMARYGRGLICLSLTGERIEQLGLRMMVDDNRSPFKTAFTVSIEARRGVSTGISAADRATTILAAVADDARPDDLVQPGHVFSAAGPQRRRAGADRTDRRLGRSGPPGRIEAGRVICEIMNDDGTMARRPDLEKFAEQHGLKIVTIADLIAHRMRTERLVQRVAQTKLPTYLGEFTAIAYTNQVDSLEHIALVKGVINPDDDILVRVHSECLTGDALGSLRCDCGDQLKAALSGSMMKGRGFCSTCIRKAGGSA
jgi:3,4-dihydroxy 2-butanone 4-phosphate synthase/GTP cyclohydrolase II